MVDTGEMSLDGTDDRTLLLIWARDGAQPVFASLSQRYAGLIYHAALWQMARPKLAE